MKPGIKTSEFWIGLVVPQIVGIAATFGFFTPEQADVVTDAATQGAGIVTGAHTQIMGLVTVLGTAFGYANSRGKAKSKE